MTYDWETSPSSLSSFIDESSYEGEHNVPSQSGLGLCSPLDYSYGLGATFEDVYPPSYEEPSYPQQIIVVPSMASEAAATVSTISTAPVEPSPSNLKAPRGQLTRRRKSASSSANDDDDEDDEVSHRELNRTKRIKLEQNRRDQLRTKIEQLHLVLPPAFRPIKSTKCGVLDGAIAAVQQLALLNEDLIRQLQESKAKEARTAAINDILIQRRLAADPVAHHHPHPQSQTIIYTAPVNSL